MVRLVAHDAKSRRRIRKAGSNRRKHIFSYPGSHWHIYLGLFYNRALLPGSPGPKKVAEDVAKESDLVGEFQIW